MIWIYDIETLANCTVFVFFNTATKEWKVFVIHPLLNQFDELMAFLKEAKVKKSWFVGFNNVAFDGQIVQYLLDTYQFLTDPDTVTKSVYDQAQRVIELSHDKQFLPYPEFRMDIKQLDLYKLNHMDNKAKACSLKWVEFSLRLPNIEEMPIHHSSIITTMEEIETIVSYCKNDVSATYQLYLLSIPAIKLRHELTQTYGINLYNASEIKLSKEIFAYYLCKETGIEKRELKELRTFRDQIVVKDLLFDYYNFTDPIFKKAYDYFHESVIYPTTKISQSIPFQGSTIELGMGGAHYATKSGIVRNTDTHVIKSFDYASYYPNIAITANVSPAQLPAENFCKLYKKLYEDRKEIPKANSLNKVYKLILNGTYGLSKEMNSYFYDPLYTYTVTINGQLILCAMVEELYLNIPEFRLLFINTDGSECYIPRKYEKLYDEICNKWSKKTGISLEYVDYEQLIIGDVF